MKKSWLTKSKALFLGLRGNILLVASSPLWIAVIQGIFQGRLFKSLLSLASVGCFTYATLLTKRYFYQLSLTLHQENPLPVEDTRKDALWLVALGALIVSALVLRRPPLIAINTLLAGGAYYFHYCYQTQDIPATSTSIEETPINPADLPPTLRQMIQDAQQSILHLRQIAETAYNTDVSSILLSKLQTIINLADTLLHKVAQSPEQIRQMRTFFVVILPELEQICARYFSDISSAESQQQFLDLLNASEAAFTEQQQALIGRHQTELDIKMTVLKAQLTLNQREKNE
ncbi:5-bromo-4-chloroindolyl phosphate hydrolysis family protein [Suttonella ornithocola]|uniref:5-bromo-4-chloroindolyl phosphate hydrolysis protein n=1 Tax=Suttonella ornithocola TaxID=279832 RepID=A0A380MND4_9GAMM|nr:5-bromo-4-chloroindolyl phosphate hydrolysis family protein [Suttonella ornithocola]SUO93812.1 Uncharacterised protein [Suttonella ornithocola]